MMRVLPTITVTPAILQSTTVAGEDPSLPWSAIRAWAKDELCHRVETHKVYRRITAGTTPGEPENDPDNWKVVGPTNKWAMFDMLRGTRTTVTGGPLTVVLAPGQRVDSLGLLGLVGSVAEITVHVGATQVYEQEIRLQSRSTRSWYEYFTRRFNQRESVVRWNLPPYRNSVITATIQPISGVAACGRLSMGMSQYIGEVLWDGENDAINFSRIEREFDGSLTEGVTLLQRRSVPKTSQRVRVPAHNANNVLRLREQLNAVPALWAGMTRYPDSPYAESMLIHGIYRRFSLRPENKLYAMADIELEEM